MISFEKIAKVWNVYGDFYWEGLGNTLWVAALAVVLGSVLGLLVASGRMLTIKPHENVVSKVIKSVLKFICTAYVEVLRATPLLVQVMVIYFGCTSIGLKLSDGTATRCGAWSLWA